MDPDQPDTAPPASKQERARPSRRLPTPRLSFDKQMEVLRAYGAASGVERRAVSNAEVAAVVRLNQDSVSLCNPFWIDVQLLVREGNKQRPTAAVFDYLQAHQWHPESAATKLGPAFADAWFGKLLLPRLAFKSLTRLEAIRLLADEIKAPKEFEPSLSLILDYLKASGIIALENGNVMLPQRPAEALINVLAAEAIAPLPSANKPLARTEDIKTFQIPIPGKADATISVPTDLDADDWEMLSEMLETYVERWKRFGLRGRKGEAGNA
jgi:hypothetical protein